MRAHIARQDWNMRQTVDIIAGRLDRREIDAATAARVLREHMVPLHVAQRVIATR